MTPIETLLQEMDKLSHGLFCPAQTFPLGQQCVCWKSYLPRLRAALASQPVTMTEWDAPKLFSLPSEFERMPDGEYFGFHGGKKGYWEVKLYSNKFFDHNKSTYYQFAFGPFVFPYPYTTKNPKGSP